MRYTDNQFSTPPRLNGRGAIVDIAIFPPTGAVFSVPPPIVDVYFSSSGDDEFEFTGIENGDESRVDDFVEASQQTLHLLLDAPFQPPLDHAFHVLLFVTLRHHDVLPVRLQFPFRQNAETLLVYLMYKYIHMYDHAN